MDSAGYHKQCSSPASFSRKQLEDTHKALQQAKSKKQKVISAVLETNPIEKPKQHRGGRETDYFEVTVSKSDAETIIQELGTLEAQYVSEEGLATPMTYHYASLLDRWLRYVGVGKS
ncbi:MAG: hypothetical protein ACWA5Q_08515 [bacterium]